MNSSEELKERITAKACELFQQFGCHKVSMDEIAAPLGISKKTLYKYFDSKETLIRKTIEARHLQNYSKIEPILNNSSLDFFQKMEGLFTVARKFHSNSSPQFMKDLEKYFPDIHQKMITEHRKNMLDNLELLFREGIEQNVIRADIYPEILLKMFSAVAEKVMTPEVLSNVPFTADKVHKMVNSIFFQGILTEQAQNDYQKLFTDH